MQFINNRESALNPYQVGLQARWRESFTPFLNQLTGEESPTRLLSELGLLVLLMHIYLAGYLLNKPSEPETPAEPLIMDVALIAAQAPQRAKPAPPAPQQFTSPKRRPALIKPKKAAILPKKTQAAIKPASAPALESAPASKPETASAPSTTAAAPSTSSPPVSAPASLRAQTETFTEANYRANYKSNPKPNYPHVARSRGWQGKVLLRVQVTADGHSAGIFVQQSSGHKQLDEAAIEAVKQWTFIPAKRGDKAVASTVTVPIQFKLNE
ncbi:MAG: TonB family protein [Methylosarcina sp.]